MGGGKKYEVSRNDGEGRFGRHDEGIYGAAERYNTKLCEECEM